MDLAREMDGARRNDAAAERVAKLAETFRASGQVGDLIRLRDGRLKAGQAITGETSTQWADRFAAPPPPDLFSPAPGTLPEVPLAELNRETLWSAMHHHGALIVRGMFSARAAFEFREEIDTVIDASRAYAEARQGGTLDQLGTDQKARFLPAPPDVGPKDAAAKAFLMMSGAVGTFLSPRASQMLLDEFERLSLRGLLQGYFGDEPCLSYYKSVLRRAEPLPHAAEWHQDGAFMTEGIDSLNLWVALTECGAGTDSPGMDLVPRRLNSIVKPGENGAAFAWSVSGATVAQEFPDLPPAQPWFGAGDAVFFDHFNLHATSSGPEFTRPRYAIETWFFPKSRCAVNQVPVAW